eukprot:scaffold97545_cov56-Phaeocystis_antarctica.AAC.1
MARRVCRGSGPACRLDAARPRGDNYGLGAARLHEGVSHLSPLAARASPYPTPPCLSPRAPCLRESRADRPLMPAR